MPHVTLWVVAILLLPLSLINWCRQQPVHLTPWLYPGIVCVSHLYSMTLIVVRDPPNLPSFPVVYYRDNHDIYIIMYTHWRKHMCPPWWSLVYKYSCPVYNDLHLNLCTFILFPAKLHFHLGNKSLLRFSKLSIHLLYSLHELLELCNLLT